MTGTTVLAFESTGRLAEALDATGMTVLLDEAGRLTDALEATGKMDLAQEETGRLPELEAVGTTVLTLESTTAPRSSTRFDGGVGWGGWSATEPRKRRSRRRWSLGRV